jgi:hypothetical protein
MEKDGTEDVEATWVGVVSCVEFVGNIMGARSGGGKGVRNSWKSSGGEAAGGFVWVEVDAVA